MRLRGTGPSAGHVAPLWRSTRALASLVLPLLLMWQPLVPPEPARAAGFFEVQLPGARRVEPSNPPPPGGWVQRVSAEVENEGEGRHA